MTDAERHISSAGRPNGPSIASMKNIAAATALLMVGCGGVEYEPSALSRMDVVGVWSEVYRSEDPPALLLVADEPMHHHDPSNAYLTPGVTIEEMAHVLTHVWIERTAKVAGNDDWADGDPNHVQSVWAANQPGEHVIERAAVKYLLEHSR